MSLGLKVSQFDNRNSIESRHVVFNEYQFPYQPSTERSLTPPQIASLSHSVNYKYSIFTHASIAGTTTPSPNPNVS